MWHFWFNIYFCSIFIQFPWETNSMASNCISCKNLISTQPKCSEDRHLTSLPKTFSSLWLVSSFNLFPPNLIDLLFSLVHICLSFSSSIFLLVQFCRQVAFDQFSLVSPPLPSSCHPVAHLVAKYILEKHQQIYFTLEKASTMKPNKAKVEHFETNFPNLVFWYRDYG